MNTNEEKNESLAFHDCTFVGFEGFEVKSDDNKAVFEDSKSEPSHTFYTGYSGQRSNDMDVYLWPVVKRLIGDIPAGSRILDAGCGQGSFTEQLLGNGRDVCGVELDRSGVDHARARCPDARIEQASVYDDLRALFGDPFDLVVSLEVIEHLYDPRLFVQRVRECLKPGGRFVVSTPYNGWLKNVAVALLDGFDVHAHPLAVGGHIKFWSRATLGKLLTDAGFAVDAFAGAGRMPWLWKSMVLSATRRRGDEPINSSALRESSA